MIDFEWVVVFSKDVTTYLFSEVRSIGLESKGESFGEFFEVNFVIIVHIHQSEVDTAKVTESFVEVFFSVSQFIL